MHAHAHTQPHSRTMRYDTGLALPRLADVKGYTLRPPVLRPMRSVS
jgi:hypothetical protein